MLRNTKTVLAVLVTAGFCGMLVPASALAITQITNTAAVNYNNELAVAQAEVTGSTTYAAESDPVLTVLKTRAVGKGPSGTMETFYIKVTYPMYPSDVEDVCGDDSDATSVVVTDAIPAGFTYEPGTLALSTNDGGSYTSLTDGDGDDAGDYNVTNAGAITVSLGTLTEGTGDETDCSSGNTARIVRFQAEKN